MSESDSDARMRAGLDSGLRRARRGNRKLVYLVSYPRSGNTLVREYFSLLQGRAQHSIYPGDVVDATDAALTHALDHIEIIKSHPVIGWKMAEPLAPTLKGALEVIRHHHEKLDGSGYPDGLRDGDISAVARIMAVADIYDALVTDRPYRRGMTKEGAIEIMQGEAEKGLIDSTVVLHLTNLLRKDEQE